MPLKDSDKSSISTRNILIQAFYEARTAHQEYPQAPWNKKASSMPTLFRNLSLFQQYALTTSDTRLKSLEPKQEAQKWDRDGSIEAFGKLLLDFDCPNFYQWTIAYLTASESNWRAQNRSGNVAISTLAFASYFLHRVRVINPLVFKSLITDAFNVVFLQAKEGEDKIILYRGDRRPHHEIFTDGFKEREEFRPALMTYASYSTGSDGVSTSSLIKTCVEGGYANGNGVYVIEISAIELEQQLIIVDIDATLQAQRLYQRGIREMNSMSAIPGRCIRELIPYVGNVQSGAIIPNPNFSIMDDNNLDTKPRDEDGFVTITPTLIATSNSAPALAAASSTVASVNSEPDASVVAAACAVSSNSTANAEFSPAAAAVSPSINSSLVMSTVVAPSLLVANGLLQPSAKRPPLNFASFTFQYRGRAVTVEPGQQNVRLVFQGYHDIKNFIRVYDLRSETNPADYKHIDSKSQPGSYVVRVSADVFEQQIKAKIPELSSAPKLN